MIGLKNRKSVEGWALDVSDPDNSTSNGSLRQRLADNTKLWLVCFVVVIGLGLYFIKNSNAPAQTNSMGNLPVADSSSYDPVKYAGFSTKFAKDPDYSDILVAEPEFMGPEKFKLTVAGDTSRDEIEYMARMAAQSIGHKFHHRVTVQVYVRQSSGSKTLTAYTAWNADKGYTVKFKDDSDGTFK